MKCHICGAAMRPMITSLPFKTSESSIVVVKDLPVFQCANCPEYAIEDSVMERVEAILSKADTAAELEIIRYAA